MATIAAMLAVNSRHHCSRTAVVSASGSLSWGEVADRSARLATALRKRGLQPGDRLALVSDNCSEILETYYAAALSGVIAAPTSTRAHPDELARYYGDYLHPRAALLGPGSEGSAGQWLEDCDIVVSLPGGPDGEPFNDFIEELCGARLTYNYH
ncbi:MAG: AMP-binding protein, partial [Acidimicrobiia bacterium]